MAEVTAGPVEGPMDDRAAPTLVIADDDPIVRAALSAQLGHHYRVVAAARDAAEAVALVKQHRPEVALVDVQMPEGGGVRATRDIKAALPGTTVVALSGDEEDGVVREMLRAGAVSYLRKGLAGGELRDKLRTSLAADRELSETRSRRG